MILWLKGIYQEFTPRTLKALISSVAIVGFVVYLYFSSGTPEVLVTDTEVKETVSAITKPKIFVHIAGKVKHPGIYQLDSGARVFDAVLLAGGFTSSANQSAVNLARVVIDGEQIVIGVGGSKTESTETGLISLNRSDPATLEDLPGVGPALAGRIVDWREANGGFQTKEDLLNVQGIGDKLFAGLKDLVTL